MLLYMHIYTYAHYHNGQAQTMMMPVTGHNVQTLDTYTDNICKGCHRTTALEVVMLMHEIRQLQLR